MSSDPACPRGKACFERTITTYPPFFASLHLRGSASTSSSHSSLRKAFHFADTRGERGIVEDGGIWWRLPAAGRNGDKLDLEVFIRFKIHYRAAGFNAILLGPSLYRFARLSVYHRAQASNTRYLNTDGAERIAEECYLLPTHACDLSSLPLCSSKTFPEAEV